MATCFHLKEYTLTELSNLLREAGFAKVSAYPCLRSHYMRFPLSVVSVCEAALRLLPHRLRRPLAGGLPFRALLDAKLAGKR